MTLFRAQIRLLFGDEEEVINRGHNRKLADHLHDVGNQLPGGAMNHNGVLRFEIGNQPLVSGLEIFLDVDLDHLTFPGARFPDDRNVGEARATHTQYDC